MIRGMFDLNTHIDTVFGLGVATTQDNGCGLRWHYTEVLYGTVLVSLW
jgi:hypothetical protein